LFGKHLDEAPAEEEQKRWWREEKAEDGFIIDDPQGKRSS
jgi:hypothetical protein